MTNKLKASPIPLWVNLLLIILILFMLPQVYWNYFDNEVLLDSGITIQGDPDQNVIYTTAGRLVAMIAVSVLVLFTQNPAQYVVVIAMSAFVKRRKASSTRSTRWRTLPSTRSSTLGSTS